MHSHFYSVFSALSFLACLVVHPAVVNSRLTCTSLENLLNYLLNCHALVLSAAGQMLTAQRQRLRLQMDHHVSHHHHKEEGAGAGSREQQQQESCFIICNYLGNNYYCVLCLHFVQVAPRVFRQGGFIGLGGWIYRT